jgi:hypothetical protein
MTGAIFWTGTWAKTAEGLRTYVSNCELGAERGEAGEQSHNAISIILSIYYVFFGCFGPEFACSSF